MRKKIIQWDGRVSERQLLRILRDSGNAEMGAETKKKKFPSVRLRVRECLNGRGAPRRDRGGKRSNECRVGEKEVSRLEGGGKKTTAGGEGNNYD